MDVFELQVLCHDGLHLYKAPLSGLLFSHYVYWKFVLAAES